MKTKPLLLLSLFFGLSSCTLYIPTRTYVRTEKGLAKTSFNPNIVFDKNLIGLNCKQLGTIKLEYSGVPGKLTKEQIFDDLRHEAYCIDANLINIVKQVKMTNSEILFSCLADMYIVQDDIYSKNILSSNLRDTLVYDTNSKLKWADFKILIPEESNIPYQITTDIRMTADVNAWLGTYKQFSTMAVLFLDASGVKKSFMTESNLRHIQLIYDLTQIYSKRVEKYMNQTKKGAINQEKIQGEINEFADKLKSEVSQYSIETEYGKNIENQRLWSEKIENYKNEFDIQK